MTPSRQEIFTQLVQIMEELFEVPAASVTMDSVFYEDLDIDSIDAVDLMARLGEISGRRVEPDEFKIQLLISFEFFK